MTLRRVALDGPADVAGWRAAARRLLAERVPPGAVVWTTEEGADLFLGSADELPASPEPKAAVAVPRGFLGLAEDGLLHSDRSRFDLFYRLLLRVVAGH